MTEKRTSLYTVYSRSKKTFSADSVRKSKNDLEDNILIMFLNCANLVKYFIFGIFAKGLLMHYNKNIFMYPAAEPL
jgi:hypothetical protein